MVNGCGKFQMFMFCHTYSRINFQAYMLENYLKKKLFSLYTSFNISKDFPKIVMDEIFPNIFLC